MPGSTNRDIDRETRKPAGIESPADSSGRARLTSRWQGSTTDLAYVRMHGPDHDHLYSGSYSDADLAWWAARIQEWNAAGKDVFVYFNNDGDANAVRNARTLRAMLGH